MGGDEVADPTWTGGFILILSALVCLSCEKPHLSASFRGTRAPGTSLSYLAMSLCIPANRSQLTAGNGLMSPSYNFSANELFAGLGATARVYHDCSVASSE